MDYGPCAFIDTYHPMRVFSSIDHGGRYAYANQPRIAQWNLARLAQSLLPVLSGDEQTRLEAAQQAADAFSDQFQDAWLTEMRAKLGLEGAEDEDASLIERLLTIMEEQEADFTLTFRGFADGSAREQFSDTKAFDRWLIDWRSRGGKETSYLNHINPVFIPRNHLVDSAIKAGLDGDFKPFEDLLAVLSDPYTARSEYMTYANPPQPDERVYQTFCGT